MLIMYFDTIPAKAVYMYINKPNCIIVDIRQCSEYVSGHIPSAVNIPHEQLQENSCYLEQFEVVVLYCSRGNISLLEARKLHLKNSRVLNVYGGLHAYRGELVRGTNSI